MGAKRSLFTIMFSVLLFTMGLFAGTENKIFPYDYTVRDLDNGLRVVIIPTGYPNIVSLQIPVQTGSRNEVEPGKSGFAHFFEHMMFRGTDKFPSEKYGELLKNAGADQNAYTTDDYTNYHITFSKEDLETVLMLEGDRFQNLNYSEEDFKTESRAVLGEYNKNSANPIRKLLEAQRDRAFKKHTYKHTTMGFIQDIEDMPNQFDYSREFFSRWYRPENTVVILAGDLEPEATIKLVEKYFGEWKPGNYRADIPVEPAASGPEYVHIPWQTPTLPYVTVAFHGPAFSETENDMAVMDVISQMYFSESSKLYQKLVVREQVVDDLFTYFPDRIDPYMVTVFARLRDTKDAWYVRDEIMRTFARARTENADAGKLADIKAHMRYAFAAGMDNSASIAGTLASYMIYNRDPETINKAYALYETVTSAAVKTVAARYFTDKNLVVTTLSNGELPTTGSHTGSVDALAAESGKRAPDLETVLLPGDSPLINFRILFNTGAMYDPSGKTGLAQLTANMITGAGSKEMKFADIQKAFFPMAAGFSNQVDKEMTVFTGTIHRDNLAAYYGIISNMLLNPGWDEADFKRVKNNLINEITVSLRENNEEELGKEVLYEFIYRNHPYGRLNLGHVADIEKLTLDDVREFYQAHYTRANLVLGLAGNYGTDFLEQVKRDLGTLPAGNNKKIKLPVAEHINGFEAEIVRKETRATAISFGFPVDVNRSSKDFAALWLVRSWFGEHRSSNSYLYQRIREIRGMNYGDYAYIEYFPRGMFLTQPDANNARSQQIFQVWIRPVRPEQAHFAVRTALYELGQLIANGMRPEDFEATRKFLLKNVNILTSSQDRQLGYALDSKFYGTGEFTTHMQKQLQELTLDDVNRVLRKYLQDKNIKFVFITRDADDLKKRLVENTVSPISYDAQKPAEILDEDKILSEYPLNFKADKIRIVPVEEVFVH